VKLGLVPAAEAEARLQEVLPLAGIREDWLDRGEDALSVGQRQRICLGRVLLSRPCVLLLDEPTSSLDPPGARALVDALRALGDRRELTLLMVTHRLAEARRFGGEVLVLDGGRRCEFGPAAEVVAGLEHAWGDDTVHDSGEGAI
jgi:ABC-type methionine transport system ATPase subunit